MKASDKEVKKKVIKARQTIRQKNRLLRANREAVKNIAETKARPLVEPLRDIAKSLDRSMFFDQTIESQRKAVPTTTLCKTEPPPPPLPDLPEASLHLPELDTPSSSQWKLPSSTPNQKREELKEYLDSPDGKKKLGILLGDVSIHGRPFIEYLLTGTVPEGVKMDRIYGPRIGPDGKILIGDSELTLDYENIYVNDLSFPATEGLFNLLFLQSPEVYTREDLNNYADIVRNTNVARRGFSRFRGFNSSGQKYRTLLKNLLRATEGSGFNVITPRQSIDYIYWNDVNELVDRLRLLTASAKAGNDSHTNEIEAIIEELLESGIITDSVV